MRTLLGTHHRVRSVDVMSCSRRTINHWTIFIYMKRGEKRSEKTGTCFAPPFHVALQKGGGSLSCKRVQFDWSAR